MNKKIISFSVFLTLFFTTVCPFQVVFAQQMPGPNPIHPDAVPGSTSQRQQAWESMTPQQQDQAVQDLQQIIQQTQYQPNSPYSPNDKYEQETTLSSTNYWGTVTDFNAHQETILPNEPLSNGEEPFDSYIFQQPQNFSSSPGGGGDPCSCDPDEPPILPAGYINFAFAANGGTASASSTYSGNYPVNSANDGNRTGIGWGSGTGGWNDATAYTFPD
jgi:hypothetical protein